MRVSTYCSVKNLELARKILWETIEYYGADPVQRRSYANGGCLYEDEAGARCAIGRLLTDEEIVAIEYRGLNHDTSVNGLVGKRLPLPTLDHLGVEVGLSFLGTLQGLHDEEDHWDAAAPGGLSDLGNRYVRQMILEAYHLNEP